MAKEQSLLAYLCTENPEVIRDDLKRGSNSTPYRTMPWVPPAHIREWEDFDFDTLKSIYGGKLFRVLNENLPCKDFSGIPPWPFCHVADEDSIETLLCKWTQSTVSEALLKAQNYLYGQPNGQTGQPNGQTIFMARGGQGYYKIDETTDKAKVFPDWSGIQPFHSSTGKHLPMNILPGDTKVSSKWHSRRIPAGYVENRDLVGSWINPISQVQTYCRKSNARYGYIITDEELVVLRVRRLRHNELTKWLLSNAETRNAETRNAETRNAETRNADKGSMNKRSANKRSANKRSANKGSANKGSANKKGILKNESTTSMQDESQETNGDTQETDRDPAGTKHEGDSDEPVDTDENPLYRYVIEYKAIDWDQTKRSENSQEYDLTINLALWWLHMMASKNSSMENSYPALREEQQTWEVDMATAEDTAGRLPTESGKRKRSSPYPVTDTESTSDDEGGQSSEGSKTKGKRVRRQPSRQT